MNQTVDAPTRLLTLLAPVSGIVVPLDAVPDPVFSQRLAGDGVAIDPLGQEVVAPCAARVLQVHRAGHAVTLEAAGLEIVIHVGLDTVTLKGEGFQALVRAGDRVHAGQPLLRFDADTVARRARSLLTEVVVASMDRVAGLRPSSGRVVAGRDVLLEVTRKDVAGNGTDDADTTAGDTVTSAPVAVATSTGLHARPAAVLAATARGFTADLRVLKGGREANLRSVVSVMALEIGAGDPVVVVGRGPDAAAAVAALVEALATDLDAGHAAQAGPATPPAAEPATADGLLRGVAASPGVAVGAIFRPEQEVRLVEERAADPERERHALAAALSTARGQVEALQRRVVAQAATERGDIFTAHLELLADPDLLDPAHEGILAGATAGLAWQRSYTAQAERLAALASPVLRARATDVRDVGRRVLHLLTGGDEAGIEVPAGAILVAEDLTPSELAGLDRDRVRGLCTTSGSATSHAAILARGFGIPAVAGMDPRVLRLAPGTRVILDGGSGTLDPAPDAAAERRAAERQAATEQQRGRDLARSREPATTRDGHRVEVVANLASVAEAARVVEAGGEGVGLLRTEFLFMERPAAPDEDEQAASYEAIVRALGPERILVIRTLDVGGDKPLPYLPAPQEANPFLGERGVRFTLAHPELFRAQVRAALRASRAGRVAVMLPMIATLGEWRAAREQVEHERRALGVDPIPVGIMVETAAAALLADRFAAEADFFSIGTNDLTQYTLAMDRTNPRLAPQVDALHPAVLRLIELTVAGAHAHRRWVGVCGAAAGDPQAIPVLLGLGVDELSADLPLVPAVKERVRALSLDECRATAREALAAGDGSEVRTIVGRRHP